MIIAPENVSASIGKAILAVQYFEQWLVCAYYHMRIVTEDEFSLTDAQLSDYRLFKNPTKNLIKVLAQRSQIDPRLESRINGLLEQRHTVVHRWFLVNGTPATHTSDDWDRLAATAESVASEALELSFLLIGYMGEGLRQQVSGQDSSRIKQHMARMFMELENGPKNSCMDSPVNPEFR
jgi:hypothetical protein